MAENLALIHSLIKSFDSIKFFNSFLSIPKNFAVFSCSGYLPIILFNDWKFIKILEFKHDFATISYFRDDGLMASYYPDFMIETQKNIYLVETKSDKDLKDTNVKQKQKSTLDFVKRINNLSEELREFKTWAYLLLGETQFYSLVKSGADIEDLANSSKMNELVFTRNLFDIWKYFEN